MKSMKNNDLEDMVSGKELTYNKVIDKHDIKYSGASTAGYILPTENKKIKLFNLMLVFTPL